MVRTATIEGGFRSGGIFAAALLAALSVAAPGAAAAQDDLYSATVIVTGRDNLAERARGIGEALPLVLMKVSLDEEAPLLAAGEGLLEDPERLVADYSYRDRKEGIQISDEQGTRDRSFELTVRFDAPAIDALLREADIMPYRGPRPEIGVVLEIEDGTSRYLLTQVSQKGYGQRMAFADAARALGLPVRLPEAEAESLDTPVRLEGQMTITAAGHWDTAWRATGAGGEERFFLEDTTFDVAIRGGLYGSVSVFGER